MSRYAEAHAKPNGPGDGRPTALQIIKDEGVEGKLKDEAIVITGTSSGIGIETTRALATTGATLFLTARNVAKAQAALAGIFEPSHMEIIEMDQESLSSVRAAAAAILAKTSKIHLLVNNAGIMAIPELRLTADGHELQFGTNHLSHFLFYKLLEPALLAAASSDLPSRVVNLSSSAHNVHGINDPDNYDFQKGGYDASVAYGQSKTANIYMANEIERRYGSRHLHATSVHPGIVQTGLTQHMPPDAFKGMEFLYPTMKSVEQGAATSVWAAVGKAWEHEGGKYLVNCAVAEPYAEGDDKFSALGYAPHAYDVEKARRLWSDSLKIVGFPDEE
ncbi:WW domain-containing oxidoreductase [Colletotrichum higginsianum]|uniref:WW domain-containing oxidoreductase n=2 Tax=Colletotrichum higginsianum TaxID=80884 RepID=H1VAR5_COLHI|nr:WW domain-containing oxidoreductase [Colletotrichum higginsianum IMI 349063]OBR04004.1 WW domain-containing oxidoreductase [Colletotrichum higginsianum IMI 349063]TIC90357.1 WW domain-containing oxidoreductase [Colletotrichum higginsianum]CCF37318.1 WW domain-containing oxidoreductase [Colletotrichum higginsianum]